jgi:hypothetical protein
MGKGIFLVFCVYLLGELEQSDLYRPISSGCRQSRAPSVMYFYTLSICSTASRLDWLEFAGLCPLLVYKFDYGNVWLDRR